MSARKKRSKKPSGASSTPPPRPTLFLDRNLGKNIVAKHLRSAGISVEVHDDHLPLDAPDEQWIELVGRNGWVAVTKDEHLRYRASEYYSIQEHSAGVIVIRMRDATGPAIGEMLTKAIDRIARFAIETQPPFLAKIYANGTLRPLPVDTPRSTRARARAATPHDPDAAPCVRTRR